SSRRKPAGSPTPGVVIVWRMRTTRAPPRSSSHTASSAATRAGRTRTSAASSRIRIPGLAGEWSVALGAMGSFGRRQLLHGVTATAMLAAVPRPMLAQSQDGARAAMARAAAAFVQSLEPAQRQAHIFPLARDERRNWHYIPRSRAGVAFKDMSPAARAAAHELMKASLSGVGYAKAVNVVKLEEVLRQLETFGSFLRDPEKYYVSVFGAPEATAPWGWRLEGHHLSLNFTLVPGPPRLGHARVLRRQSAGCAVGPPPGAARAGRGAGPRVRPRARRRREPARPSRHRRRVARRHRERARPRRHPEHGGRRPARAA